MSDSFRLFPSVNKFNTTLAILQWIYSVFQGYCLYGSMIHDYGFSSPFLIILSYIYMSFMNSIAKLVQGSYTHVTIILPSAMVSHVTGESPTFPSSEVYRFNHSTSWDGVLDIAVQQGAELLPTAAREELSVRTGDIQQSQNETAASELELKKLLRMHYPFIEIKLPDS